MISQADHAQEIINKYGQDRPENRGWRWGVRRATGSVTT